MTLVSDRFIESVQYSGGIRAMAAADLVILAQYLDTRLQELSPEPILGWCEGHIILKRTRKLIEFRPYQRFPIEQQVNPHVEEIYITGPEQFGKSITWQCPAVYKMRFAHGPKLIVYESDDKAESINRRRFEPMVRSIPELRAEIDGKYKKTRGTYELANGYVDFVGAGKDVTSQEYRDVFGDEVDTWSVPFAKKLAQVENLQKRSRSYRESGEGGQLVLCSSCKGTEDDSAMWQYLKDSSLHVFHLACQYCGAGIDTTQIDWKRDDKNKKRGGLRWKIERGVIVPESIRLYCPVCDHAHKESQALKMEQEGQYIARNPGQKKRIGCIFGGLSSSQCLRWSSIAEKRQEVAETNEHEIVRTYHNSFRGVPMPLRDEKDKEAEADIRTHCADKTPKDIVCVLGSADTQESPWGWYWIIRGIDQSHCTHLISCGFAHTKAELETAFNASYHGRKVDYAIIDQGGTNADDVKDLARRYRHIWQYKGNARQNAIWKMSQSKDQVKLILCDAERLQVRLLRSIYDQAGEEHKKKDHYWFLPPLDDFSKPPFTNEDDIAFDYLDNMINVRDLGEGKNSHLRQNWTCKSSERRDFFDCEKMIQVLALKFQREIKVLTENKGKVVKKKLSDIQRSKRRR